MKRKIGFVCLSCALLLAALSACGSSAHTHSAVSWDIDLENHWHICGECGETFDSGAHTLENEVCTVCGAEVETEDGGAGQLALYNEQGDYLLFARYDADGGTEYEERYEYTYDAEGNKLTEACYINGSLSSEYEYAQSDSGDYYTARSVYYGEDGAKTVNEFDEKGNISRFTNYTAEGVGEYYAEYAYNEDASWMSEKEYYGEVMTAEREYSIEADGEQKLLKEITYNEDGSWVGAEYDLYENQIIEIHSNADGDVELDRRFEHTYDDEGNKTLTKTYDNGVLVEEVEFWFGSDDDGSWSMSGKTTTYHEDGTKTVVDGDLEATWSSETTYDAAGNVVEELRYEYDQDENGEAIGSRGYKNGKLFVETKAITGADGEPGMLWTEYNEDGTKTVTEYNEGFDVVKETVYDAGGNVISESE